MPKLKDKYHILSPKHISQLCGEFYLRPHGVDVYWEEPGQGKQRHQAWDSVKDAILAAWQEYRSATRPRAWYDFDSPGGWHEGEDEMAYLERVGEVTRRERELLQHLAWEGRIDEFPRTSGGRYAWNIQSLEKVCWKIHRQTLAEFTEGGKQ